MSVPGIVQESLGQEGVAARVELGGEDELYVTPTRTLIYRGEGLLSDEAVEEYPHQASRVVVSTSRRKAKITLQHGIDGDRSFSLPVNRLDDALHPVMAGVLNAASVTEPGETVKRTFLFSELTLIVTSHRLVKHIGEAVWDADYEEYPYEDATDLTFEEGSVATQLVLEVGGRRERIKAPNEQAPEVRAELEEALFEFHDVTSVQGLRAKLEPEDDGSAEEPGHESEGVAFEGELSPLDAVGGGTSTDESAQSDPIDVIETGTDASDTGHAEDVVDDVGANSLDDIGTRPADESTRPTDAPDPTDPTGAEPASIDDAGLGAHEGVTNEELAERLDELTTAVRRQNELVATHADTLERLIEELKRLD